MNRRNFLAAAVAGAGVLYSLTRSRSGVDLTGEILGASHRLGHLLRDGHIPEPTEERRVPVVIVGGGISGLSAGWKLAKAGLRDFEILELEAECGGNSRWGENSITAYPWGAHYVPLPTPESKAVRELFEELGVIEGYSPGGEPVYQERYLCFSPQERLYLHGRWQEGLLPLVAVSQKDLEQYERFKEIIAQYRRSRGRDGRKAFAIPMEFSSRDPQFLQLDRLSMRGFLLARGLDSAPLHWYVNYACRDDYGTGYSQVSAWAGLHYFASRDGGDDEIENSTVLTWPEGNGWIVKRLRERLSSQTRTRSLVFRITPGKTTVALDYLYPPENRSIRIVAEQVIVACPRRFARHLLDSAQAEAGLDEFEYAPWMVANLSLRAFPQERAGTPLAWDNVIYDSPSLGYVVATHQSLRTHLSQTVFTYYYPLAGSQAKAERARLLETGWRNWVDLVLKDLSKPHPEIRQLVQRMDIVRWGHAMVRPRPGFIWGAARQQATRSIGAVHFAHSDLSGFSLFEEAQYRGVAAAEIVLAELRIPFTSSLA